MCVCACVTVCYTVSVCVRASVCGCRSQALLLASAPATCNVALCVCPPATGSTCMHTLFACFAALHWQDTDALRASPGLPRVTAWSPRLAPLCRSILCCAATAMLGTRYNPLRLCLCVALLLATRRGIFWDCPPPLLLKFSAFLQGQLNGLQRPPAGSTKLRSHRYSQRSREEPRVFAVHRDHSQMVAAERGCSSFAQAIAVPRGQPRRGCTRQARLATQDPRLEYLSKLAITRVTRSML